MQVFEKEMVAEQLKIAEQNRQLAKSNNALQYFTGNSKNLGWINCDRYVKSELVTVSFTAPKGACQVVILRDINSVLNPNYNSKSEKYNTASVPRNAKFKLLTLKVEEEYGYISVDEGTASNGLKIEPQFKKVPLEEINKILAKL
jgi:hypothetical protein